jgi:hypothetical protein
MFKKIFLIFILTIILSNIFVVPVKAIEAIETIRKDYNETANNLGYATTESIEQTFWMLQDTRNKIVGTILGFAGIVFLILIVMGGYEWMFSGGNEERVTKAKQRIRMAVNGLIIVLGAYILAYFILEMLFKSTV